MKEHTQFAIITPTYKRSDLIQRAVNSVRSQTYNNYLHIIVNDSPDADYREFEKDVELDIKIVYIKNKENVGKNASLNTAFEYLQKQNFIGYIVFLDDDDWLSPDCLANFAAKILETKSQWLVSNRVLSDGSSITKNRTGREKISYTWDYLIHRAFSGDATHTVDFEVAKKYNFPTTIKNADEWIFFACIDRVTNGFIYMDTIGTYTDGYLDGGLTIAPRKIPLASTWREMHRVRLVTLPTVLYLTLRALKRLINSQR